MVKPNLPYMLLKGILMDKRDKRILRKLGHPILNIGINEDVVKDLRKDSMDDYNDIIKELFLEYNTTIYQPEEVINNWVERYTLSLCKIAIGRTIGRVTENNSGYTIDYETLLKEGVEEQQTLRGELIDYGR